MKHLFWVLVAMAGCECTSHVTSTAGVLVVSPSALDFGLVELGGVRSLELKLENQGNAALELTVGTAASPFVVQGATRRTLLPGATDTVTVEAHPLLAGPASASLSFETSSARTPEVIVPLVLIARQASLDAGPTDAGLSDAGPMDAGGPTDAGPTDAGRPDAGLSDAGLSDAGSTDAGPTDAGPTDAGPADAGPRDAGVTDGGADAGLALPMQMQVAAHRQGACALTTDGGVWCWGNFALSATGAATGTVWPLPIRMNVAPAVQVAASLERVCALIGDGGVSCFGQPLGAPRVDLDAGAPWQSVSNVPPGVEQVEMNQWVLCVRAGAEVWCAGDRLGLGLGTAATTSAGLGRLSLPTDVVELVAATDTMCARTASHQLWCWGGALGYASPSGIGPLKLLAEDAGVEGPSNGVSVLLPARSALFDGGLPFSRVSFTTESASPSVLVLLPDAGVVAWDGPLERFVANPGGLNPVPLTEPAVGISAGPNRCVLGVSGRARCWGSSPGDGTTTNLVNVGNSTTITWVDPFVPDMRALWTFSNKNAGRLSCVVTRQNEVWCWGSGVGFNPTGAPRASGVSTNLPARVTGW